MSVEAVAGLSPRRWLDELALRASRVRTASATQICGRLVRRTGDSLQVEGCPAPIGARCLISSPDSPAVEAEVIGFDQELSHLLAIDEPGAIAPGATVRRVLDSSEVVVDERLLGRVLDGIGRPLDGREAPARSMPRVGVRKLSNPMDRPPIRDALDVGVRGINALFTLGLGQRVGLFAPSGVGKSELLGMMTRFTEADVVVVAMVGERAREVREFIETKLGPQGLAKSVVFVAAAGSSALLRIRAATLATEVAEHFSKAGKRVLLLMDSLTRFAEAHREIALAAGEIPAARGFPPSTFSRVVQLVERCGTAVDGKGAVTAVYTVLTQDDVSSDPVGEAVRAILDGHLVLSHQVAHRGTYPALDIESSVSRVMAQIVAKDHLLRARRFKQLYSSYEQNRELIMVGAYAKGGDAHLDEAVAKFPSLCEFLGQDLGESCSMASSVDALTTAIQNTAPQTIPEPSVTRAENSSV